MDNTPKGRWPAGHRAALVVSFDVDDEYGVINRHGADSWYWRSQAKYDQETGIWRVLEILKDFDLTATFCWVGRAAEDRPDAVRAAHNEGHEIATHGWDHRYFSTMTPEEQRADLIRTRETLEQITGTQPVGHKTPGWYFNEHTVPVLQELGFQWNMDIASADLPYLMQPDRAKPPVVQLPPSWVWDDYSYFVETMMPPRHAFETWREELDAIRLEGKLMNFTFHPLIIGRPGLSRALVMFLDYVISLGDVWIARADQVAYWWHQRELEQGRQLAD